ncbi:MAG: DUF3467 domain-containing protein [Anaerolineales bacterium]
MALPPPRPAPLPIEVPADLQPAYVNIARIAHAPAEFVLEFARILPGEAKAIVGARVIMSPVAAKLLLQALTDNLGRYESTFGPINVPSGSSLADQLFRPPPPPEPPPDKK